MKRDVERGGVNNGKAYILILILLILLIKLDHYVAFLHFASEGGSGPYIKRHYK